MNIELSTENLTKMCRICLNEGRLNIQNKVRVDPFLKLDETPEMTDIEVTINDIMQIFNKWEHKVWDLSGEMHMICTACSDELVGIYLFYKKLERANQHIKRLYKAAMEIECDASEKECTEDYFEDIETLDDDDSESVPELPPVVDECPEEAGNGDDDSPIKESMEQMSVTNATEEPMQYVKEEEEAEQQLTKFIYEPEQKALPKPHIKKRKKTESLNNASLVIGQFIPTATPPNTSEYNTDMPADTDDTCMETRTLEYAPVVINSNDIDIVQNYQFLAPERRGIVASPLPASGGYGGVAPPMGQSQSVYVCKYCPNAYSAPDFLIAHIRKSHVCQHCMQAFNKDTDLYDHLKKNHQINHCKICQRRLSSRSNLRAHLKRVHGLALPAKVSLMEYKAGEQDNQQEDLELEQKQHDRPEEQTTQMVGNNVIGVELETLNDMQTCDFVNSIIECDL